MVFSPSGYLRGLGWGGPGEGLNDSPNARAKAITVPMKKTLAGVGKDRDTAFPWWEMVFANVAGKVGGSTATTTELRRTTTGILSRLPPPKPNAYAHLNHSSTGTGGINQNAMADAKMEAAKRQLYSGFLRGAMIGGSEEEDVAILVVEEEVTTITTVVKQKKIKKEKRKRGEVEENMEETTVEPIKLSKEERREAKRIRKALPSTVSESSTSPPPPSSKNSKKSKSSSSVVELESSPEEKALAAEEKALEESREIARRAAKQERKLEKAAKKALKGSGGP